MSAVLSSLVDDRLGPGPVSEDLVRRCAEYTDNSGGIAFREYRRAVEVVFDAAEVAKGSPVIISPLAPRVYHDVITAKGVEAIYADVDRNTGCLSAAVVAELAQVIVQETGEDIRVYTLYTGSLGAPGSGADSYLGLMREDVRMIVEGLAPGG